MPIKINGKDYLVNGVAQDYLITNPLDAKKAEVERLQVRIEFLLKPGTAPELKVSDKNKLYQVKAELCDRQTILETCNCINLQTILENR